MPYQLILSWNRSCNSPWHYIDVIMTTMVSQITSRTVVYSTVYSDADQRKHQSSASLAFVWGIHRDRWIPRTKGQLRGKCFHLMTSSWYTRSPLDRVYRTTLWTWSGIGLHAIKFGKDYADCNGWFIFLTYQFFTSSFKFCFADRPGTFKYKH